MTRFSSTFTRLASIGLAAFALAMGAMVAWRDSTVALIAKAASHVIGWAMRTVQAIPAPMAPPGIVHEPQCTAHQRMRMTVANACKRRMDKRPPAIEPGWRMCAST